MISIPFYSGRVMRRAFLSAWFVLLPLFLCLPAFAQTEAGPRIEARATWDDRFVYFAFVVDNTDLLGTNAKPMSNPEQDDSIGVYLHTGKDKPETPTPETQAMLVSAAGGFTYLMGDAAKKAFAPRPLFSVKYGVTLQGSLNRSDDRDQSYTVTLAIPLPALGLDAKTIKPGTEIAFNVVARQKGGAFSSLSGAVKTDADIADPAKWTRLVLLPADGAGAEKFAGAILAPRVLAKDSPPQINGTFKPTDWPDRGTFALASPHIPKPMVVVAPVAVPGAEADAAAPALPLDAPFIGLGRRIMARYRTDYQADLRKPTSPNRSVFGRDGSIILTDQPITGIGPWFSTDRVNWHRGQLTSMRETGIDVALAQLGGPLGDLGQLDEKALVTMVAALREMAKDGVPAPEIAPIVDMAQIVPSQNGKPDLATDAGRDALYTAIQQWFMMVPPEFRFRALLPTADGRLVRAYPVFLSDANGVANPTNGAWTEAIRKRFAADFGTATTGTTLLFVGGDGFAAGNGLGGNAPLTKGGAGGGAVASYVVQPGFESVDSVLIPRKDTETFAKGWEAADNANAAWLIIDSWNDFSRATEIAASRQYGQKYLDITRILAAAHAAQNQRAVRWLDNDAPRRLRPGQAATIDISLQNAGSQPLRGVDGVSVTYRWKQGDKIIAEAPLRLPLPTTILPTRSARLPVGIIAARAGDDGKLIPLPPGDYTVEIDFTTTPTPQAPVFFSDAPDHAPGALPLRVPVTINADLPDTIEFASTTTPVLTKAGGIYAVSVRLRWMGAEPLKPEAANLVYQILTEDGKTTLYSTTAPLTQTLSSGQWQTETLLLRIGNDQTFPIACPESRKAPGDATGGYRLRWLVSRTQSTAAIPGEYTEHIAVYPPEEEIRIVPVEAKPLIADADATMPVEVAVTNRGTGALLRANYRIGYHWYDSDGVEFQYRPAVNSALPVDIKPGETIKVPVTVRMPERAGVFVLAFDALRMPDIFISTRPVTRGGDLGLLPVRINGGRLRFVDLTKLFTVDAVAWELAPADGNLDGAGSVLPAESFPPDGQGLPALFGDPKTSADLAPYPSGYYADLGASARRIAFRYGDKAPGKKNAIICAGQALPVPPGRYVGIHLAAAATGGEDKKSEITLRYKDGSTQKIPLTIGDWNRAPGASDPIALRTDRKRTKDGDKPAPCYVRHTILPADITRELTAILLPNAEKIVVFAVTLEK